ncbi:MAG: hypothetical protein AB9M60_18230 [Leptothrix sp. (in: b-proteobacteria)]
MLASLSRLWRRLPGVASDSRLFDDWAHQHGDEVKRVRNSQGGVVTFGCQGHPARLEWGPSQRSYIVGRELRLRIELDLPPALEMMVMSRTLADFLEAQAFEQLTRGFQTEIDATMPEEARWLSMFTPVEVSGAEAFSKHFVVLAASSARAQRWVQGELATRLHRAGARWLLADAPFVLLTLRGRIYLRTAATRLDPDLLNGVRQIAEIAAQQALALVGGRRLADAACLDSGGLGAGRPRPGLLASLNPPVGQVREGAQDGLFDATHPRGHAAELTSLMSDFGTFRDPPQPGQAGNPSAPAGALDLPDLPDLPFEADFDPSLPHDLKAPTPPLPPRPARGPKRR